MKAPFWEKKVKVLPYDNLVEEEDDGDIISKKEERLRKYEKTLTFVLTGTLLLCVGLITYLSVIMAEDQGVSEFANNEFAVKMFNVLKSTQGNVFFSPYSLQMALAMTYTGATGNTAKELQKCFSFSENKDALYKAVQNSTASIKASKEITLSIANGMFLQKDYQVKETFSKVLSTIFQAEAKSLNFGENVKAANEINSYVDQHTQGKIQDLFSADAFNSLTRLVLVNAIYFKGAWMNKFDPNDSFKGDFFLNNKDKVKVDYMKIKKRFNFSENVALNSFIVELPYEGEFSMVLVVPKEIEGIKFLENNLHKINLQTLTNDTVSKEVELIMPKFKLEQKLDLVDALKEVGIKDMFDSTKADFGGITDKRDLYVSKVVQKAYIEVNEEGSEAAAATGLRFVMRTMPPTPKEVYVKGPFLFFVRHASGSVLFVGRVSKL